MPQSALESSLLQFAPEGVFKDLEGGSHILAAALDDRIRDFFADRQQFGRA
jgi:hypothetical protein